VAHCPNCGRPVEVSALRCAACGADFSGRASWKPVSDEAGAQRASDDTSKPKVRVPAASLMIAGVALVFFVASLFSPALHFARRNPVLGYEVLMWGGWGPLAGSFAWFANPLLVAAGVCLLRGRAGKALALSLLSACFAATSPLAKEWWFSEAGGTPIAGLGVGFHLWAAAIATLAVAAVVAAVVGDRVDQA
jgi:hypothetical protein